MAISTKAFPISSVLPKELLAGGLADSLEKYGDIIRRHLGKHLPLQSHPFAALNSAFIHDGAFVYMPERTKAEAPIQLLYVSVGVTAIMPLRIRGILSMHTTKMLRRP